MATPTSPPRRSTRSSRPSTSARCTRRPTPALAEPVRSLPISGRLLTRAAALLLSALALALAAACSGGGGAATPTAAGGQGGRPAETSATPAPSPAASPTPRPADANDLPARDLYDLARRFRGVSGTPTAVSAAAPPAIGSGRDFYIVLMSGSATAPPRIEPRHATLRAISDHAYFYWTDESPVDDATAREAASQFEGEVYQRVTADFGSPPPAGVAADAHVVVVHTDLGGGAGGYFAGGDRYPRAVSPYSNEAEAIYLDASITPGTAAYREVIAHEFAHLIQDGNNTRQQVWLDEGLSVVASQVVGGSNTFQRAFEGEPQTQLNAWSVDDNAPHYGAAGLFLSFLLGRYGSPAVAGNLERERTVGEDAIDDFLRDRSANRGFEDVFGDWAVANIAHQPASPYAYEFGTAPDLVPEEVSAPSQAATTVPEFTAQYYEVNSTSPVTFHFQGDRTVPIIGTAPHGGSGMWWSNRGDSADTRLTRPVDLTGVSTAALHFSTWYDIEEWYDYGYVAVSTDGGVTWTALAGRQTTTENPAGEALGPGYTGISGGGSEPAWVEEQVDLTPYAGKQILLRFELVTDYAYNRPGWAIDDISIPEIGWADNAESAGDWQAEGFRRITAPLQQRFILKLVEFDPVFRVTDIPLSADNTADVRVQPQGTRRPVIVVAADTRGTTETTGYSYSVAPAP